jgi:flagellar motor switch/type III secretory pathway protein FliN
MSELLGTHVGVIVRRARSETVARGLAGGAAVLVAPADAPDLAHGVLVEAELALVALAVARVTRRKAPAVLEAAAAASPATAGAFGAIVLAALRRAHAGIGLRVVAAGPAVALEEDLLRARGELRAVSLTVLVGDDAFDARVALARASALAAALPSWDEAALAAMGPAPLAVPLAAHAVCSTAAEVAMLAAGDVLVAPGWPLTRGGEAGWTGPVVLAAPSSSHGLAVRLGDDGGLVLGGDVVPLVAAAAEAEMGERADRMALVEAIGEVPVVVRVEIGEASMAAREWASLGRGDVIALGRRVGEPVVLRVGGVAVARGDLVEIDGEVGVRIVDRLGAAGA